MSFKKIDETYMYKMFYFYYYMKRHLLIWHNIFKVASVFFSDDQTVVNLALDTATDICKDIF